MSKKLTKIAIAYDFDGTLSPINMQEAKKGFIDAIGITKHNFYFVSIKDVWSRMIQRELIK